MAHRLPIGWAVVAAIGALMPNGHAAATNAIAAIVNDEIITVGQVEERARESLASVRKQFRGQGLKRMQDDVMRYWLNFLVQKTLLRQAAKKAFESSPDSKRLLEKEVGKEVKRLVQQAGSLDRAKQDAEDRGLSWEEKTDLVREGFMVQVYLRNMIDQKISVSPEEMRRYYNKHLQQFSNRKRVKIRRILIKYDRFKTLDDAWDRARGIAKRIHAGEDFALLARTYSHGPRAMTDDPADAGLFGFDEVHGLKPELREMAMTMRPGQVSKIIAGEQGLEIIKVEDVQPARRVKFEQAQNEIRDTLKNERRRRKQEELLDKLEREAYVKRLRFGK